MDVYHDNDTYTVTMDLPGVDPSSIDIDVNNGVLTVNAERKAQDVKHDENSGWVSRERSYGTFARQVSLDTSLDTSNIKADYTDGELTVTIPVAEEAKPQKVQVTQGQHKAVGANTKNCSDSSCESSAQHGEAKQAQPQHA